MLLKAFSNVLWIVIITILRLPKQYQMQNLPIKNTDKIYICKLYLTHALNTPLFNLGTSYPKTSQGIGTRFFSWVLPYKDSDTLLGKTPSPARKSL